eukprot:CAMPEP_0168382374 /NCGR_PEP_ID=MMETSP0228-20121227/13362_1 /TAXON_ID=133427 /ORGANISM="Protoceratium reticulatum, Strain CCCM 535 (=CCMP 1889)" /LENGTH=264 /DNA_ID=CAMNT_0008395507 /DNA_START=55 /DNA_END=846 /DNA_ORIENTATION=+
MDDAHKMQLWRLSLFALALVNSITYLGLVLTDGAMSYAMVGSTETCHLFTAQQYKAVMQCLALPYVFQTSWRCVLLSEYPNRRTYYDHPLNSVLVARLLAAVGEFCFGAQLAMALYTVCVSSSVLPQAVVTGSALCIVALDGIGQGCATYATIQGSSFPFFIEGLMWSGIFAISLVLASTSVFAMAAIGTWRSVFLLLVIALTIPGLVYMAVGYCPLCWEAWRKETMKQRHGSLIQETVHVDTFRGKAWEALTVRAPTREWSVW